MKDKNNKQLKFIIKNLLFYNQKKLKIKNNKIILKNKHKKYTKK